MKTYGAITEMLNNDSSLSLNLYFTDLSYGVKNFRTASIEEPDPYEGKVANPESGLDQQFLHGPRRSKNGFKFEARSIVQALDLLEKACNSKKGLENTVRAKKGDKYLINGNYVPAVHGFSKPQSGLDVWIFNEFYFEIQQKENRGLFLEVTSGEFDVQGFPVSSKKISNVKEAIELYQNNPIENSIIRSLQKGILINAGNEKYADLKLNKKNFSELSKGVVTSGFLDKYNSALESLKPFNISKKVLDKLFTAMLLDNFYSDK